MRFWLPAILVFQFQALAVCAQEKYDAAQQFPVEQLRQDFALLRKALETTHSGLHRYVSEAETNAVFDEIAASLNRPMTEVEFYQHVSRLNSVIQCGHTGFRRPAGYYEGREKREPYLPLQLRFLENRCWVYRDLSREGALPPGTEILRINGRAVSSIVEQMMPHLAGDGSNRTGRLQTLDGNFTVLYTYLVDRPLKYLVEALTPERHVKLLEVEPLTLADQEEILKRRYPGADAPSPRVLGLKLREDLKAAILTIPSFGGDVQDAEGNDYQTFLERSFQKIRDAEIENLIVDLRGNGGGRDVYGAWLFSYLTDREFRYYDYLGVVVDKIDFLEHTSLSTDFHEQLAQRTRVEENGRRVAVGHPNLEVQKPKEPGFGGRVYYLIDGGSFSATAEFAAVAQFNKRGTFIGRETGGGFHGNTSGMSYRLTLPNTGLQVRIPIVKYVSAVGGNPFPDRGVIPDFWVEPTIEDLLAGRDPVMEFALGKAR